MRTVAQLLQHGSVRRGRIGVAVQNLTADVAEAMGVPLGAGALIGSVQRASPAEYVGLKAGDVISAVEGDPINDANGLRNRIGLKQRGEAVDITFYRKDRVQTVRVRIGD